MPDSEYFERQAKRCRRLARQALDPALAINLVDMAEKYEAKARELRPGAVGG